MRSTTYAIPNTHDMIKQSHIPIALAISPLANVRSDEVLVIVYLDFKTKLSFKI